MGICQQTTCHHGNHVQIKTEIGTCLEITPISAQNEKEEGHRRISTTQCKPRDGVHLPLAKRTTRSYIHVPFPLENALCPIRPNLKPQVYVKPHLVVRWVSVWFRKVASQHVFWLGGGLDISLFFRKNLSNSPPHGCLAILLNDSDLRNWLLQRSRWNFRQPKDIVEVLEKEPSFFRNTQHLYLRYCHDHIRLHTLGILVSLTRLDIVAMGPLNLDAIAEFCPFLNILDLELRNGKFEGSLAPL